MGSNHTDENDHPEVARAAALAPGIERAAAHFDGRYYLDRGKMWQVPGDAIAAEIRGLIKTPEPECKHEWQSIVNEVIKNGSICMKCGRLKP